MAELPPIKEVIKEGRRSNAPDPDEIVCEICGEAFNRFDHDAIDHHLLPKHKPIRPLKPR